MRLGNIEIKPLHYRIGSDNMNGFLVKSAVNGIVSVPLLMWLNKGGILGGADGFPGPYSDCLHHRGSEILPATNNSIATAADFGLAFLY